MKKQLLICCLILICSTFSFADIISWDASSGLLPSDASISDNMRFQEIDASRGYSTIQNGIMTIHDDSNIYETAFSRNAPPVYSDTTAAFQITTKVIWADRSYLNTAGEIGFLDTNKSVRIGLTPDRVGFVDAIGRAFTHSIPFNTTDDFHSYRVIKNSNTSIQLFIDDMLNPVLDFSYSELASVSTASIVRLWQGSNRGQSKVEIKDFAYNVGSIEVPEPTTLSLLTIGGLLLRKRKKL